MTELQRARKTLLLYPGNLELRRRSLDALVDVAQHTLADGPLILDVEDGRIYSGDHLVLSEIANDSPIRRLESFGVHRIELSHELANVPAILELVEFLNRGFDDSHDDSQAVWEQTIPGVEWRHGDATGFHVSHASRGIRLAGIPVGESAHALRSAVEREVSIDPKVRVASTLLRTRDGDSTSAAELEFVTKLFVTALEDRDVPTAAELLAAASRGDTTGAVSAGLRHAASEVCNANWWESVAETATTAARPGLTAFLLEIPPTADAADRILGCGTTTAIAALLQAAPDAASTAALERTAQRDGEAEYSDAVRVVLANRPNRPEV